MVLLRTCSWKPAFPYSLGCDKISGHHYSINSCLADRRTRLMRDKESIYASHLENIVILRKQRYTWVAGTLLKGKALASTSFSLSHKKSAQMGFTWCNDSGGSSHSRSPLADWSMFSDVMLTASICQHNSGVVLSGKGPIRKVFFSWLLSCSECIILQNNSQGHKHCLHTGSYNKTDFGGSLSLTSKHVNADIREAYFLFLFYLQFKFFQERLHMLSSFHFFLFHLNR